MPFDGSGIAAAPAPLYRRVYDAVAAAIADGRLLPGDRLPSERELCDRFSVSRATVRRAFHELHADGLIESSRRRGSFVRTRPVGEPPNALMSFRDLAEERGLTPSIRVLGRRRSPATLEQSATFGVAPGRPLIRLERLLLLDDVPFAVDLSTLPLMFAPSLEKDDLVDVSIFDALADADAAPVRADVVVRATEAEPRIAGLLNVEVGSALVVCQTTSYDARGRVVEVSDVSYPGTRYEFRATLVRNPTGRLAR